jgi:hypothetical protein
MRGVIRPTALRGEFVDETIEARQVRRRRQRRDRRRC